MGNDILLTIKIGVAAIGTFFTYLFGGWDTVLIVLATFVALDYITGIISAWKSKELSSDIGAKGIAKKAAVFIVLIVAVLLDRLINDGLWVFRTLVCYFYIANEGVSILENAAELGLPVPKRIIDALAQLKDDKDE